MIRRLSRRQFSGRQVIGLCCILALLAGGVSHAVSIPHRFEAGKVARASDVNENFDELARSVDGLQTQMNIVLGELNRVRAQNSLLQLRLASAERRLQFFSVQTEELDGVKGPHLLIEGANVHIRSGSGSADDGGELTGLGNLIVGYNEVPASSALDSEDRAGSHNVIVGRGHKYRSFGGLVAGESNSLEGKFSSITGGRSNVADGDHASVSGGELNSANGDASSVSGGRARTVEESGGWRACENACVN
ncbi:MAG: hypothetical protein AAF517_04345 [Planctomycetota bacterium]